MSLYHYFSSEYIQYKIILFHKKIVKLPITIYNHIWCLIPIIIDIIFTIYTLKTYEIESGGTFYEYTDQTQDAAQAAEVWNQVVADGLIMCYSVLWFEI